MNEQRYILCYGFIGRIKLCFLLLPALLLAQEEVAFNEFDQYCVSYKWKEALVDQGTSDWESNWFLDGEQAAVSNDEKGMHFMAGPEEKNDAHHAVMWTKGSFKGDLRIEYDYVKTDQRKQWVTILYIQATGVGKEPYSKDIFSWNELRTVPSMRTYFNNMNSLHISYAAFGKDGIKYIRARRYPTNANTDFPNTLIEPSYNNLEEIFQDGINYHISVLKVDQKLFFKVEGDGKNWIFKWDLKQKDAIKEGRIGLRHMYTRSALYKNFKVYTREN